jgi:hypothetical protein
MKSSRLSSFQTFFWAALFQLAIVASGFAQVADPVLSPSAGSSASNVTVTVSDSTPGITAYYTTNGSTPTTSSSAVPSTNTLTVSVGTTLKVQAYQGNATPSNVVTAQFTSSGFVTSGTQHAIILKNDGTIWATGLNSSGQLATGNTTSANLPVQATVTGVNPIASTTSRTMATENGLPIWWELQNFGQTGLNPSALAPNGSGLTILQSYQQGVNPQQIAPIEPFAIAISATGPFQAPANPVVVANVTHPSATTITQVQYYNVTSGPPGSGNLIGTSTTAPYTLQFSGLTSGLSPINW